VPAGKITLINILAAFIIAIVIIIFVIPYGLTADSGSCTICHSMRKYYDSWKESPHAIAARNCFVCHVKPGFVNSWLYRTSFYREIYASIVGVDLKPFGATLPGTATCQNRGCHSLNRKESIWNDIKIDHSIHVKDSKMSCLQCHPGAVHPNVGTIGSALPKRENCRKCHQKDMNNCSFCHTRKSSSDELMLH
jgi:nitrate/TMAO reductase-like tetraheme cytochrome c subunit